MRRGRAELEADPAFAAWSAEELDVVTDVGDRVDLAEGTVLARAGLPARQAFVVVTGVAVAVDGAPGEFRPGDVVCDIEPVTGEPARRSVRAASPLTVLVLSPLGLARLRAVQRSARRGTST